MRSLFLIPAIIAVAAASNLPETVPLPEENPRATVETDSEADKAEPAEIPAPDVRPDTPEELHATEKKVPEIPIDLPPPPANEAALTICESRLKSLGAEFERQPPIDGPAACGLSATYLLKSVAPGVSIRPETEMTCDAALATAQWVRDAVLPAARALGENIRLRGLVHASTYVCRNRNNQPEAKISEHARGAAIDVSTFEFDGHELLPVEPRAGEGSMEEAFQKAVRGSACLYFTTVLGPGSDSYHDDHIHLDLAKRSRGYRLCQ
jgi:hypothetical protein